MRDGAVLPILHLNGYKIANPTVLARIPDDELMDLLRGYGYEPMEVEVQHGDEIAVHQRFARVLDAALDRIAEIQRAARGGAWRPRSACWRPVGRPGTASPPACRVGGSRPSG